MRESILLVYDESPAGKAALERAFDIASQDHLRLHVLAVAGAVDVEAHVQIEHEMARLDAALAPLRAQALARGVEATLQVVEGAAALEIPRVAREQHARLIVIGHRHRGLLSRLAEMSVAKRVLDHAPCEVLVVGSDPESSGGEHVDLRA